MTTTRRFKSQPILAFDMTGRISASINMVRRMLCIAISSYTLIGHAATPYESAKSRVISQPCSGGETVDQYLDHKRRSSHRDLGWRVFEDDEGYIVERSFMVSKAMEIRYRWHIDKQDGIYPTNSRTEDLCS